MKKSIIFLVFIFTIVQSSFAQSLIRECVYLKNGSIIKGLIIEQVPNESLKIETADGSIFVYKMSEVEKITKEVVNRSPYHSYNSNVGFEDDFNSTGFKGIIETGYTIGTGDYEIGRFELNLIAGYKVTPNFLLGAGTGIHFYSKYSESVAALPLFGDFRFDFSDGQVVPFAGIKAGYTFNLSDHLENVGLYFAPSVGIKYKVTPPYALNMSIGYTVQLADNYSFSYDYYRVSRENLGGISLKLGFEY